MSAGKSSHPAAPKPWQQRLPLRGSRRRRHERRRAVVSIDTSHSSSRPVDDVHVIHRHVAHVHVVHVVIRMPAIGAAGARVERRERVVVLRRRRAHVHVRSCVRKLVVVLVLKIGSAARLVKIGDGRRPHDGCLPVSVGWVTDVRVISADVGALRHDG